MPWSRETRGLGGGRLAALTAGNLVGRRAQEAIEIPKLLGEKHLQSPLQGSHGKTDHLTISGETMALLRDVRGSKWRREGE